MRHTYARMFLLDLALHLKFTGAALIFLGVSHAFFGKRFNWAQETARLSPLNRQIFYVHTFFIALICVMMGVLALLGTRALTEPTLAGNWLCARIDAVLGLPPGVSVRGLRFQIVERQSLRDDDSLCVRGGLVLFYERFAWAWWRQIW